MKKDIISQVELINLCLVKYSVVELAGYGGSTGGTAEVFHQSVQRISKCSTQS